MEILVRIGKFARNERELEGLSRRDVAYAVGVSVETIKRLEFGEPTSLTTLLLVISAIGYEHDDGLIDFFSDLQNFESET